MIPDKHKAKAAWIGACIALCSGAEGFRQTAYRDVTGIPTICFGETRGVQIGDRKTRAECEAMLEGRLYQFGAEVDRCTTVELPPARKAAMTDFAYNLGSGRYCQRIAPLLNIGRTADACDKLLEFTKAGGVVFPGLVKRRAMERDLCMDGLGVPA